MAVTGQALADHPAGEHVERGEQGRGAVAFVVVGHRPGPALLHRQARLGAVERLDLALFVHAEHDRVLGRVQIQADDIDELLLEARVVGELERLHLVRLQAARGPDPLHRRRADPVRLGHRPAAPVRLTDRLLVQRRLDDLGDLLRRDRRLPTPARAAHPRTPSGPRTQTVSATRPRSPATHRPEQRSAWSPYPRRPTATRSPAAHHGAPQSSKQTAAQAPPAAPR